MSDPRFEVKNAEIEGLLRNLGAALKAKMPPGSGYTLLIFNYAEKPDDRAMFYLSTAMRADMVKALREFLAREQGN